MGRVESSLFNDFSYLIFSGLTLSFFPAPTFMLPSPHKKYLLSLFVVKGRILNKDAPDFKGNLTGRGWIWYVILMAGGERAYREWAEEGKRKRGGYECPQ